MPRRATPIRGAAGLPRRIWRLRGKLDETRSGLSAEMATALEAVIESNAVTRAGFTAYRATMRTLVAIAVVDVVAGVVLILVFRDSPLGLILGGFLIACAAVVLWWQYVWSAGLRFMKEHVDPARRVPVSELPARLAALAKEADPISTRLADELGALAKRTATPTQGATRGPDS